MILFSPHLQESRSIWQSMRISSPRSHQHTILPSYFLVQLYHQHTPGYLGPPPNHHCDTSTGKTLDLEELVIFHRQEQTLCKGVIPVYRKKDLCPQWRLHRFVVGVSLSLLGLSPWFRKHAKKSNNDSNSLVQHKMTHMTNYYVYAGTAAFMGHDYSLHSQVKPHECI
jgi:hypothetical protein